MLPKRMQKIDFPAVGWLQQGFVRRIVIPQADYRKFRLIKGWQ
jgi:hypothetical protein